jgi:NTE family protein
MPGRVDSTRPRIGLALGSGSARGWAHIGIIDALLERGIEPQVVTGASVGALVGAAYASGRLDQLKTWVRALTQREVWRLVDATFRGGGVMTGSRLMQAVSQHTGNAPIEELPLRFGAVATDVYTGQEVWITRGPMLSAVRASSGMPGLFAPSWHEDRWLVDGGVVNPVPVSLCRALGAEFVIAVDLSRKVTRAAMRAGAGQANGGDRSNSHEAHNGAGDEGRAVLQRWRGLVDGLVESYRDRRSEPGLFEVMTSAVYIMQDRITRSRMETEPADFVIKPDLGHFQLMDFHRGAEAIDVGRAVVASLAAAPEDLIARAASLGQS